MPRRKPSPPEPTPKAPRPPRYPKAVDPFAKALEARQFRELRRSPTWTFVYSALLNRRSVPAIAAEAADRDPALAAIPRWTLLSRMYRLRRMLPEAMTVELTRLDEKHRRHGAGVDVIEEMDALVRYQKSRVATFMDTEASFQVPVEQQRREVLTLMQLLKDRRDTAVMMGLHPGVTLTPETVIDARQVHVTVGQSTLEQLLDANPSAIPMVMNLFDGLEALDGPEQGGGDRGDAADDPGATSGDPASVRPVGLGG